MGYYKNEAIINALIGPEICSPNRKLLDFINEPIAIIEVKKLYYFSIKYHNKAFEEKFDSENTTPNKIPQLSTSKAIDILCNIFGSNLEYNCFEVIKSKVETITICRNETARAQLVNYIPIKCDNIEDAIILVIASSPPLQKKYSNLINSRYRLIFENSPISLWEEDFSEVIYFIEELKKRGVTDFRRYFDENPDIVNLLSKAIKVIEINSATLKLFQAQQKEELLINIEKTFTDKSYFIFKEELLIIAEGKSKFVTETELRTLDGKKLIVLMEFNILISENEGTPTYIALLSFSDISKLRNTELELMKHKDNLESLVRERTLRLESENIELMKFNKCFVGREFRIKELKEKLTKLER